MKTYKITFTMNGKRCQITPSFERDEMTKSLASVYIFWKRLPWLINGNSTMRESWEDELTDTGVVDTGEPEKGGFGVIKDVEYTRIK